MAKERLINTRFWNDNWVRKINPLDRYLFLYLLTNEYTNISGIYELPIATMAFGSGLDERDLEKTMLPRLSPKIYYKDGWVILTNFVRYQRTKSEMVTIGIQKALEIVPNHIKDFAKSKGYGGDMHMIWGSYNISEPESKLESKSKPQATSEKLVVNYFFELKGWANKDKDFYRKKEIIYARFLKPAKDLVALCDGDVEEAKRCLKKLADWAISRELDWSIETVFKKWYDLDILKPKEKKPYYEGNRVFEMGGKSYVLMPNGEKLQFAGNEKDIKYK